MSTAGCRWLLFVIGLLGVLMASGCSSVSGAIYEKYRRPYTLNLDNTPVVTNRGSGKIVKIEEPFSGYNVSAEFNSNAIGDIARRHGITKVYWADLETYSLLGIWQEQRLWIYGE